MSALSCSTYENSHVLESRKPSRARGVYISVPSEIEDLCQPTTRILCFIAKKMLRRRKSKRSDSVCSAPTVPRTGGGSILSSRSLLKSARSTRSPFKEEVAIKTITFRSRSPPSNFFRRGVLKIVTNDDSLHSKYGSNSAKGDEGGGGRAAGRVQFVELKIREYARTVSDNPSCSNGPPVG